MCFNTYTLSYNDHHSWGSKGMSQNKTISGLWVQKPRLQKNSVCKLCIWRNLSSIPALLLTFIRQGYFVLEVKMRAQRECEQGHKLVGSRTRRPELTTLRACTASTPVHFILSQVHEIWGAECLLWKLHFKEQCTWPCWAALLIVLHDGIWWSSMDSNQQK